MNLNENSITARLYKWFYYTGNLPKSLCPYFWKLVFMLLAIIPYTIISLPFLLFTIVFPKHRRKPYEDVLYHWNKNSSDLIVHGLVGYCILTYVSIMLFPLCWYLPEHTKFINELIKVGAIAWGSTIFSTIIAGIIYFIDYLNQRKYRYVSLSDRNNKHTQNSIVTEFVKAKYNKYCPKINWYKK